MTQAHIDAARREARPTELDVARRMRDDYAIQAADCVRQYRMYRAIVERLERRRGGQKSETVC